MELQAHFNITHKVSNGSEEDPYLFFYVQTRFVTGVIIFPIVCLFGIVGNFLSIIVLSKKTTSTTVYLLGLSISDLMKIMCDVLYFATILTMRFDATTGEKMYMSLYPYTHYFFHTPMCISSWLIVFVAAERFVCVIYPTRAKSYCSVRYAAIVVISVSIIMALMNVPFGLKYKTVQSQGNMTSVVDYELDLTDLWKLEGFDTTYTWIQYTIRSIVPLALLIILNTFIILGLRSCRFQINKHRTTATLVVVIVVYTVLSMPDAIMSTVFGLGYHEENNLSKGIREITDLLTLVNAAINFMIYCIFNTIFWDNIRTMCSPRSSRRQRCGNGVPFQSEHALLGEIEFQSPMVSRATSVDVEILERETVV